MTADRTSPPEETDVVIVGAGPVGAALAVDLRLRGVACVVVERKLSGGSREMRAQNTSMRTMEHFRRWGVADAVRRQPKVPLSFQRDLVFCTALHGWELGVFPAYGFRPEDARALAAEPAQAVAQRWTTSVLLDRARDLGATVAHGWECTGIEESDDTAVVSVTSAADADAGRDIRAAYVVGCDGGRSIVRRTAEIERSGRDAWGTLLHIVIRAPGIWANLPITPGAYYIIFSSEAGGLILPSGPDELNLHVPAALADESTSDLEDVVRTAIGADLDFEIEWTRPYPIHERIADSYRAGRSFIAGDAAHLFCPFGGLNMNTGIGDVANLGWKLGAVLGGWGGEQLLDSYSDERRPIALTNCSQASRHVDAFLKAMEIFNATGVPEGVSAEAAEARSRLGQELYAKTYGEWNTDGVILDERYADSPVVVDDGATAPAWDPELYQPCAKPGHRAPHVWLAEGRSLYDALGPGFTLLALGARDAEIDALKHAAAVRGVPLTVFQDADPALQDLYQASLVLIRPDQHVAWRGKSAPEDCGAVFDVLRGTRPRVVAV